MTQIEFSDEISNTDAPSDQRGGVCKNERRRCTRQHKVNFIVLLYKFNSKQSSAVVRLSIYPPWSKLLKPRRCGESLLTFLRVKKSEAALIFASSFQKKFMPPLFFHLHSKMGMCPGTYFMTSQRVVSAMTLFWAGWHSLTMSYFPLTSPSTQIRWEKTLDQISSLAIA